ncbi:Zinc finger C2H2 [Penicillium atrosanguineum]|uniref:Zinc finger C2H2 n=1 Tax=Penicillium atrosanguineum TaxID=1132637 RepID=A0A9W9U8H9_9EURO|nr:Zinc finger C2H2 [Penicillium atrosanguineum]
MDTRPASEYAQSGSHHPSITGAPSEPQSADQTSAAAPAHYAPPDVKYSQPEVRPANISSSNTPQPEYGLNPPPTRSPAYQDYLPRPQPYAPNSQPGAPAGMAQATSQFPFKPEAPSFNPDPVLDPSLPANSPSYPPPYSPYQPQGHEMAQYQGHPPPPHQMYTRPDWPHSYGQQHHMPGPYASPATTVGSASPAATAGPRPGQVYSFVPIPGAQQHKRPRRRYEEIERMYKCGWHGCEKAYGTLNHLNAHVTMQSHGSKRTPEEFKEIRKEWKARKKEEEAQRKAAEERERAAAQAVQANQVDAPGPSDPSQGQPSAYAGGVRPQLPPIGYQAADGQVPGQYGPPGGGMVYQSNGQMGYPPNYPHSPYQNGPVYQQRE